MAITATAVAQSPKSVTAWLGAAVVLLAYMAGASPDTLEPFIQAEHYSTFLRISGFLLGGAVIVNRFFIDDSLEAKAGT